MNVNVTQFQKKLLSWFARHQRVLPWRTHGNPYRTLVSEFMLQQTQIKTVIPYYTRWLKAFPNIKTLAAAPLDHVLKLWEGLGYYSRARNLHKTAQIIVRDLNGVIPSDPEELQKLPGIGRYTAGAISSIAFGKPVPLIDGNVARVLSRVFCSKKDIAKPETHKFLYALAENIVPKKNPGAFNQALMELGALVCLPEIPKCTICPVNTLCIALKKGDPAKLPVKSNGTRVKSIHMTVGFLKKNGALLIRRRPERGIWGGLWELPGTICNDNQTVEDALKEEFKEVFGFPITIEKKFPVLEHRFTHRKATIHPFNLETTSRLKKSSKYSWAAPSDLERLSFPVPHQKLLKQYLT